MPTEVQVNPRSEPTFQLEMLRTLHKRMYQAGETGATFEYQDNKARIAAVFITDERPYILFLAVRRLNHLYAFELPVHAGYRVPSYLGQHYKPLLDALGVEANRDNPFSTKQFLADLDQHVPLNWQPREIPTQLLALRYSAGELEEGDKKYFVGWRVHKDRQVTDLNLDKTRKLMGLSAYERCIASNISSCWTANEDEGQPITSPPY